MSPVALGAAIGLAAVTVAVVVAVIALVGGRAAATPAAGLVDVYDHIADGDVVSASIDDRRQQVSVTLRDGSSATATFPALGAGDLVDALRAAGVTDTEVTASLGPSLTSRVLLTVVPLAIIGLIVLLVLRRTMGASLSFSGRARPAETPTVRFTDVVGAVEAVDDLREVVDVLRDPARFVEAGARVPKGVLLVGPPGTGKTLLAKAVAAEAGCAFFAATGSDFVEMFAGVGARRVRNLFQAARRAGRAVVFIDEIDAVGRSRSNGPASGATEERESTLNALLTEMDGFTSGDIVVMAATNRMDMLDQALVRAGRFDRHVMVSLPDRGGRTALFRLYLSAATCRPGFDVERASDHLARRSTGMSGADIANVVNEASLLAVKRGADGIDDVDASAALERVAMGRERPSAMMSEREKRVVAYHEAGHTVAALVQSEVPDPMQVSIVPRGGAGGVTWLDPGDDEHFVTRSRMIANLVVAMGGRAAEKLVLDGDYTQGASGDIRAATDHATQMVCAYGMSEMGPVRIDPDRLTGDDAVAVRAVVRDFIERASTRADELLSDHRPLLEAVAEGLLEHESLTRDELRAIVASTGAHC